MSATKPRAAFLDFATLGPDVATGALDALLAVQYYPVSTPKELGERLAGCRIALLNKTRLDAAALAAATDLELVVLAATGTDNVDLAAARRLGIGVANIRDYCTTSVVQHVLALTLALTQHPGLYYERVRCGAWSRSPSFAMFDFPIRELTGLRFGIVGYGTLGQAVARAAACLGLQVLVSRRPHAPDDVADDSDRVPFPELLRQADILSLHCPLTEHTRHLIGAAELDVMKHDAVLINTARGGLVDSVALVEALRSRRIGGAGIDVLPAEPPPIDDPLLAPDVPNLIVTPHIAWAAREARQRALDQVAENVASFLAGGHLRRVV